MALIKIINKEDLTADSYVYETENLINISNKTVLYATRLKNYQVPAVRSLVVVNALANLYNITQDDIWETIIPFYGALRKHYLQQNVLETNVDLHCCSIFATLRIKYPNGNDLATAIYNNTLIGVITAPPVNNTIALPYKKFVGKLLYKQQLTPHLRILESTFDLANFSWVRLAQGHYAFVSTIGEFTTGKTICFTGGSFINNRDSIQTSQNGNTYIDVFTINGNGIKSDNLILEIDVEIRAYND